MGSSNETAAEDQQQLHQQQQLVEVHQATIEDHQQPTKMTFQQVVEQKMKQSGSKKHVMFLPSQGSTGHHEAPARLAIKKRELIKSSELTSPVDPPSVPLPPSSGGATTSLPLMLVDDILREEEEEEEQGGEAATASGTGRVTNAIIFIFWT